MNKNKLSFTFLKTLFIVLIYLISFISNAIANELDSCWIADSGNNQVVKLSIDGKELIRTDRSYYPYSVSVNPSDGSCWVTDIAQNQVVKLSTSGKELLRAGGFYYPYSVSVNPSDGSCWVADMGNNQVVKLSIDGKELVRNGGFYNPISVSVNPSDGSCWVADRTHNQVVKLSADGKELLRVGGFYYPYSVSVNLSDNTCWVADLFHRQVVKLSPDGREIVRVGGLYYPISVSVNPLDGTCWVVSRYSSQVVKLSAVGQELVSVGGFNFPMSVSVNPLDGSCWVADTYNNQIVKLSIDGKELIRVGGFYYPYSVSVNPGVWPFSNHITAKLYIKPDTLNLKSKGKWITAYIELPVNYDLNDINVNTICINKIEGSEITPIYAEFNPTDIGDHNKNGIPDLMVKFIRKEVGKNIKDNNESLSITVEGRLNNGKSFIGTDNIRIIHANNYEYQAKSQMRKFKVFNNIINPNKGEHVIIKYNLDTPSRVKITIYNIVREKIKTIVNTYQGRGTFESIWNGANKSGNTVVSGVYIVHIKTDKINETRKMMVIK